MSLKPSLLTYLTDYYHSVGYRESDVLKTLREQMMSYPGGNLQTSPEVAQLLAFFIRLIGANRVLEVGTLGGYSALAMAEALSETGRIVTCDKDAQMLAMAQQFCCKIGFSDKIEFRFGLALDTLSTFLEECMVFDMMYIDADKRHYDQYYEYGLRLVRPRGIIVFDNMLQEGKVADFQEKSGKNVAIRRLNEKIFNDTRVWPFMLPISDGVTLVIKK